MVVIILVNHYVLQAMSLVNRWCQWSAELNGILQVTAWNRLNAIKRIDSHRVVVKHSSSIGLVSGFSTISSEYCFM